MITVSDVYPGVQWSGPTIVPGALITRLWSGSQQAAGYCLDFAMASCCPRVFRVAFMEGAGGTTMSAGGFVSFGQNTVHFSAPGSVSGNIVPTASRRTITAVDLYQGEASGCGGVDFDLKICLRFTDNPVNVVAPGCSCSKTCAASSTYHEIL